MTKKKTTPLTVRERNGMISILILSLATIVAGWFVRRCESDRPLPPNIVLISDSDSIDTDDVYYNDRYGDSGDREKKRKKKSKKSKNDSTRDRKSDRKKSKGSGSSKKETKPVPQRHHLEEDLTSD